MEKDHFPHLFHEIRTVIEKSVFTDFLDSPSFKVTTPTLPSHKPPKTGTTSSQRGHGWRFLLVKSHTLH